MADLDNDGDTPLTPTDTSEFSHVFVAPIEESAADLALDMSASPSAVFVGQQVVFTLHLTNNGPSDALNARIVNQLSNEVTVVGALSDQGHFTQSGQTLTFNLGTVAAGATITATITVRADAPGAASDSASAESDTNDPDESNNTAFASADIDAPPADVRVAMSAVPSTATPGGQVTYTIVVSNPSQTTATALSLADVLPSQVTFVSLTAPAGWTVHKPAVGAAGTVTATIASLAAGASATFQLVVRVRPETAGGTQINNSAVITAANDGDASNNKASATVNVQQTVTTKTLTITYLSREALLHSELGLYVIDDASGRIGALHPGDPGYAAAALARRQVIFTRTQRPGAVRKLTLPPGALFAFYLVQNASSADLLRKNPGNLLSLLPQVFFSIDAANPDHVAHIRWRGANRFGFEDWTGGGDRDFNDLVARIATSVASAKAGTKTLARGRGW